jgi:hypothetical protein
MHILNAGAALHAGRSTYLPSGGRRFVKTYHRHILQRIRAIRRLENTFADKLFTWFSGAFSE